MILSLAAGLALIGAGLLLRSRRREPLPWRGDDPTHYDRRIGR
jgi:LPXTG-motif cell wall-anchored protein